MLLHQDYGNATMADNHELHPAAAVADECCNSADEYITLLLHKLH